MGRIRKVYKFLSGKSKGKRSLGRVSHRSEDNIKMDLEKIGLKGAS
jgi:hypothetical protein